jgi:hypothetical protein
VCLAGVAGPHKLDKLCTSKTYSVAFLSMDEEGREEPKYWDENEKEIELGVVSQLLCNFFC